MHFDLLYNRRMPEIDERVFRPEIQTHQNELFAWLMVIVGVIAVFFLKDNPLFYWMMIFVIFVLLLAIGVSLSNWIDRRTQIIINGNELVFENGLRNIHLEWNEIKSVSVYPARWGERVLVESEKEHFSFTMMSDVHLLGKVQGQIGFAQGKTIMDEIIKLGKLTSMSVTDNTYYYSRQ
jgi:uncharacterized membrane-anchored protein